MKKEKIRIYWETHPAAYRFFHNKTAVTGLVLLTIISTLSLLAPYLTPYEIDTTDLLQIRKSPNLHHFLGTDNVGRDVLTRVLYGGRISIMVGMSTAIIQVFLGTFLGAISGYLGGWVDLIFSRISDAILCFPFFVIAMAVTSIIGRGTDKLIFTIGLLYWPKLFRIVRINVQSLKEQDYILNARALGMSIFDIIRMHLIPNTMSPILVAATLSVAQGIILEASLSFLGLGVQAPQASWGNMLSDAQSMTILSNNGWMWIPAGICVIITVLSINFIGEGLQNALDPKRKDI